MTRATGGSQCCPAILARINPSRAQRGRRSPRRYATRTPRTWRQGRRRHALGPDTDFQSWPARGGANAHAGRSPGDMGWTDNRLAVSLFAQYSNGRLTLASDPELPRRPIVPASRRSDLRRHQRRHAAACCAYVATQLAAYAMTAAAIRRRGAAHWHRDPARRPAPRATENAGLAGDAAYAAASAEALDLTDRAAEARVVRTEALGWARYGFGDDRSVRARVSEIAALSPRRGRLPL